ncbi:alpha/beta fold hydrolase [Fictibacillus iocasae]|uniref:Alpha/beta fold hydrolase n=1 Tax=Fictibacillus iocasae TaxID=2715437 RepID=A0ABW2NRT7_9BACL
MIEKEVILPNGIKLHVRDNEAENKPAVLFLHFSGGTSAIWNGVLPYFTEQFRVIAPDLRGHGKSDKHSIGYHIDDKANDMYELLKRLGISECHVVGSSLGAEVGVSLAAAHPEIVMSLVCEGALYNELGEYGLFNGSKAEIEEEKQKRVQQFLQREVPVYDTAEQYLEENSAPFIEENLWNEHFAAYIKSTLAKTADGRYTSHYSNDVFIDFITKHFDYAFEAYYKKVRCPVLFMPSEAELADEKIVHCMNAFAALVDRCDIKELEGSLHAYVWMQMPDEASQAVLKFFQGVHVNK